MHAHIQTYIQGHTHVNPYIHINIHTGTHTRKCIHTYKHKYRQTHMYMHTHTHTYSRHIHARTHFVCTHTNIHTGINTHTHTHLCIHICIQTHCFCPIISKPGSEMWSFANLPKWFLTRRRSDSSSFPWRRSAEKGRVDLDFSFAFCLATSFSGMASRVHRHILGLESAHSHPDFRHASYQIYIGRRTQRTEAINLRSYISFRNTHFCVKM